MRSSHSPFSMEAELSERAAASEPCERSAPAKRRARERAGESEGRSPRLKLERRNQLLEEASRHRPADEAIALWPRVLRKILRAEDTIDERQVDREVDIHGVCIRRVMPVLIAHGH